MTRPADVGARAAAGQRADLEPPGGGPAWDLLVIGGGTAGIVAAKTAAGFGASVLLVERDRTGGDCLWTGCVPSKALLAAAAAAADLRQAAGLGVLVDGVRVDFAAVRRHIRAAITAIQPDDSTDTLTSAGVRVIRGSARFTGRNDVDVDGCPIRCRQVVVATGSEPLLPPIAGLVTAQPVTSDSVWDMAVLPRRLLVLGGGSIGCELGQAFARLGSQVTIVEAASRLLMREDPHAAATVTAALRADGVIVHTGAAAAAIAGGAGEYGAAGDGQVQLADGTRISCWSRSAAGPAAGTSACRSRESTSTSAAT